MPDQLFSSHGDKISLKLLFIFLIAVILSYILLVGQLLLLQLLLLLLDSGTTITHCLAGQNLELRQQQQQHLTNAQNRKGSLTEIQYVPLGSLQMLNRLWHMQVHTYTRYYITQFYIWGNNINKGGKTTEGHRRMDVLCVYERVRMCYYYSISSLV